jgi:hypothetical protein
MNVVGHVSYFANIVSLTAASCWGNKLQTRANGRCKYTMEATQTTASLRWELELFHIHALELRILRIATETMATDSGESIDGHAGN